MCLFCSIYLVDKIWGGGVGGGGGGGVEKKHTSFVNFIGTTVNAYSRNKDTFV